MIMLLIEGQELMWKTSKSVPFLKVKVMLKINTQGTQGKCKASPCQEMLVKIKLTLVKLFTLGGRNSFKIQF